MLYDEPVGYVAGLQIFRDFSNPKLFYFLPPEAPRVAKVPGTDDYALRLVLYRPDPNLPPPQGMEDGGGFLNLDVDLAVTDQVIEQAKQELASSHGDDVQLVPVPFTEGSVELVLLGVSRADENQPFVRKVAGSTVPSLYGTQRATFSVILDRHGAALMRQVIAEGGLTMALAIYHLKYAAIGPAYNLKITIDYSRVHESLDTRLNARVGVAGGNVSFVGRVGFHQLMEELKENRSILVEEIDPIPGENGRTETNQERINEIIRNLMGSEWFKPTLATPNQLTQLQAGATGATTTTAAPSAGPTTTAAPTTTAGPSATPTTAAPSASPRGAAQWTEVSASPPRPGFPAANTVSMTASTSGLDETLVIGGNPSGVTAGGTAVTLSGTGNEKRATIRVPESTPVEVRITWPASGGNTPTLVGRLSRAAAAGGTAAPTTAAPSGAGGASGQTRVDVAFEIDIESIQRSEQIKAVYELNQRKAQLHEVHPQGQLSFEVDDLKRYIIEADGAIDFFQWLELRGSTTAEWDEDGIDSIQVQIRYAPVGDGEFKRRGEMLLTKDQPTGSWKVGVEHENLDRDRPTVSWYEYKVTVHYRQDRALGDQSGAIESVGAPGADPQGWIRSHARNLVIHPRDVTPAITVHVLSGVMKYDLLHRVQLTLSYGPYRQNLLMSAEQPEHQLVIRPEPGLRDEPLRTQGVLFYRDGAQVQLPVQQWKPQELLVINEPRESLLRVRVILADPSNQYERVRVRLRYEHGERLVEQDFDLTSHAQLEEWAVRLEDPQARSWQYQATLIETSGAIRTTDWLEGQGDQLILGIKAEDVIRVNVTWLLVPPAGELLAVKIDMQYDDERHRVHWEHTEVIQPGHPGTFAWSIPVQDRKARTYRYKVTEFRASGITEGSWQRSDVTALVLLPGM